jgi:hypothetical protein
MDDRKWYLKRSEEFIKEEQKRGRTNKRKIYKTGENKK